MHIQFGLRACALALCATMAVAVLFSPTGAARRSRVQGLLFNAAMVLPALVWGLVLCVLYAGAFTVFLTGLITGVGAVSTTGGIVVDCPAHRPCAAVGGILGPRIAADGFVIGTRLERLPASPQAGVERVRIGTTMDTGSRSTRILRGVALLGAGGLLFLLARRLTRLTWSGLQWQLRSQRGETAGAA